ncbi:F-box/WD repeat-containing protein 5 [Centruroides vittatus]|uniref:F-box/WD repeat-containing protein 5 n=1 Tax=Centruroides vittatus TaxID=120091 RepID=UPI00350FA700
MEYVGTWNLLPSPALLRIFSYLCDKDLLNAGRVCTNWLNVSKCDVLWRYLFYRKWNVVKQILPNSKSWLSEYKRLTYCTPVVETEILTLHTDQVLHVNFSHDGKLFASSSKDGYVKVWNSSYPCTVRYSFDMRVYSWDYTQFSQFNESDTLLLVSGVHFGMHTASGEIAVFNIQEDFSLQCRVLNKPYDVFGTWYTETYLLSGHLHFLGSSVSCSVLWLNKASQETESEKKPVVKQLFKFYNKNASSLHSIMVANSLLPSEEGNSNVQDDTDNEKRNSSFEIPLSTSSNAITSNHTRDCNDDEIRHCSLEDNSDSGNEMEDNCSHTCFETNDKSERIDSVTCNCSLEDSHESDNDMEDNCNNTCIETILDDREKLLIFTMGSLTYIPHQIGIKKIKPFTFVERIATTPSLSQRLAEHQERLQFPEPSPDWNDEKSVNHLFDQVDVVIEIHGHIIGMGLSPDHRYLHVNSRAWPKNYIIEDPLQPPPIAQEIEIRVIDLMTFQEQEMTYHSHRAYTSEEEIFFIFLDVCKQYIASGAEDKHAYLWDRYYGMCIGKLPHLGIVNSVAFNPQNPEMLVTASDDFTLKVWRSKNQINKLGISCFLDR